MQQGLLSDRYRNYGCMLLVVTLLASFKTNTAFAQSSSGVIKGTVRDGSTNRLLAGVNITRDSARTQAVSTADGHYVLQVVDGLNTLYFLCPGYQAKIIKKVDINALHNVYLDVTLFPVSTADKYHGTATIIDSVNTGTNTAELSRETALVIYNRLNNTHTLTDVIGTNKINAGTDKNAGWLLNRLNGVIVRDVTANHTNQSLQVNGLGERYNQLLLNGAVFNSIDPTGRFYPLELLPAEAIEEVSLHKVNALFLPADVAGGSINIKTKDLPDNNFYLLQVGGGFNNNSTGKDFLGDQKGQYQFLSFPGSVRKLPASFPTTRSQTSYSQKNPQEQVDLAKLLNNNLQPVNYGKAEPADRILAGFGKVVKFKKGLVMGITAFVNHTKEQLIETSVTQVAPGIDNNPFPFSDPTKKIIRSQSEDVNYRYASQLGGTLNASFYFRKNKISIRNYFGNQLHNTLALRSNVSKPDEDTLAHSGISYLADQRRFLYTQVAGEHILGANSKFSIQWQVTYNYNSRKNPDERNFLLRQDSTNKDMYSIARPLSPAFDPLNPATHAANFTNTSRLWREYAEHNFTASLHLSVPFNFLHHPQVLNGGLYMQSISRNFKSDLLLTTDTTLGTPGNLLAPERYYPGGLSVTNYFNNMDRFSRPPVNETNRGNYFAASSIAASYLYMETRFLSAFSLQWGARLESGNRSSTAVQYEYAAGYRFPQKFSVDDNTRQVQFNVLPSASLLYVPVQSIEVNGAYARTLNRPLLEEMNAYRYYDASAFMVKAGNPFLDNAIIDNYSAGIKWLVNAGTHVAVNGFYKKIDQPIEEVVTAYSEGNMFSSFYNMPSATIKGVQADFRLRMDAIAATRWLSNVTLFGSGTWLKSEVAGGPLRSTAVPTTEAHTLSGSPDYSFNGGIVIQDARFPEFSLIYNQSGDYISKVGSGAVITLANGNKVKTVPDYRVLGRKQLDLQLAQKMFKYRVQLIAGVSNLLNDPFIEYQDLNGNKKFDNALTVTNKPGNMGFYTGGTDNTITNFKSQNKYYVRVSYIFK